MDVALTNSDGEFPFVNAASLAGAFYIAADNGQDISLLSSMPVKRASMSKASASSPYIKYNFNKKYVCFVVSDGDNLQHILNHGNGSSWWGNPENKTEKIAWTISPSLYYGALAAWNFYMNSASSNNQFVVGPSGIGYTYIGSDGNNSVGFAKKLNSLNNFINSTNIHTVSVFGNQWSSQLAAPSANIRNYLNLKTVNGVFYFLYNGWITSESNFSTKWYNGKPVIPSNEYLSNNSQTVANDITCNYKNNGIYLVYTKLNGANPGNEVANTINDIKNNGVNNIIYVKPSQLINLTKQEHKLNK